MSGTKNTEAPSGYTPKKLIVCCDGTWRNSDSGILSATSLSWLWRGHEQVSTNVTRIARAINSIDRQGRQQIVYYQAGVGSEGNLIERIVGGALGIGLAANIREAYSFIANNYLPGDEIYLIGFSRGAFTARSVGGLVCDLGLLNTDGLDHLMDVFEDWENAGADGYETLLARDEPSFTIKIGVEDPKAYVASYRDALRQIGYISGEEVPVKAIGVFDTVGSLGIPVNPLLQRIGFPRVLREYRFYNTDLDRNVENAFQALALDEARSAYRPALWQKLPGMDANLRQVWFPGAHTNVGGGYPDSGLSDISLAWMMSNLEPFIDFNPQYIRKQHEKNLAYLRREKVPETGLQWAAGQLKNTASGLRALLGIVPRGPGRYHVLDKKTLRVRCEEPLRNTNERIHVSIRSRKVTGGLNERNKIVKYEPKSLQPKDYELIDAKAEPGKASWRYIGKETQFAGEVLLEEELGTFEREIFENFVSASSA
ncbi:putative alpha/Beta hydrolase [Septoria linicola]|nr:putative alpha/Beta hydrolase [Septoria linicola]